MTDARPGTGALRIIVVEDDANLRNILARHLERMGYDVHAASSGAAALELMQGQPAEVVLSDIRMPGMDGRTLLQILRGRFPETKVILMTAFGSVDAAVDAMQAGAYSYVCKPFKVEEIAAVLRNVSREIDLARQLGNLKRVVRDHYAADNLIGNSPAMQTVRRLVREAASTTAPVLIVGRSGTGKELAARAIHFEGPRAGGPFVPINCGAIPETIFESEMFGYRKGAFTGADRDHAGLVEQSSGGSLFLDEVGEIPLSQQAKLLRVIEDRELRPLGATQPVRVDLRVICATNRDLEAMVRAGEFREDLYYRLNVLEIRIPELASRPEDIAPLAEHLLSGIALNSGIPCRGLTPEAIEVLSRRRWPGNVRELRNVIERALLRARGRQVGLEDLSVAERPALAPAAAEPLLPSAQPPTLAEVEANHIARVLEECGWNRSTAARVLDIDRRTLFSKIQRYGLVGPGPRRSGAGQG